MIRCIYCGSPFFIGEGIKPTVYGKQRWYVMCENCGKMEYLIINVKRLEPSLEEIYERNIKDGE